MKDTVTYEVKIIEKYDFFYECGRCKAKIPASYPDNMEPVRTVKTGNNYTFECQACHPEE